MDTADDKLMKARCRLIMNQPWYGHFAMHMVWISSQFEGTPQEQAKTMGVYIRGDGTIACAYYPPFVESLEQEELIAIIQHEIEHVVRLHCLRRGERHPKIYNIAADMTVNGRPNHPRIGDVTLFRKSKTIGIDKLIWIPDGWTDCETTEYYYDKILEEAETRQAQQPIDDHTTWDKTEMSADEARQIVKTVSDVVSQKAQGSIPGHLTQVLERLNNPIISWRYLLRNFMGRHLGNRRSTYSRRNRRRRVFGLPGISHHAASEVTVIVDTSGSVTNDDLQQFFSEIEAISTKSKVNVLQWDHQFQGYNSYRRGDWKKLEIKGRGGTNMEAPMKWIQDNNLVPNAVIMITDGYCNYIEEYKYPAITVLTDKRGNIPTYGTTIYLK